MGIKKYFCLFVEATISLLSKVYYEAAGKLGCVTRQFSLQDTCSNKRDNNIKRLISKRSISSCRKCPLHQQHEKRGGDTLLGVTHIFLYEK